MSGLQSDSSGAQSSGGQPQLDPDALRLLLQLQLYQQSVASQSTLPSGLPTLPLYQQPFVQPVAVTYGVQQQDLAASTAPMPPWMSMLLRTHSCVPTAQETVVQHSSGSTEYKAHQVPQSQTPQPPIPDAHPYTTELYNMLNRTTQSPSLSALLANIGDQNVRQALVVLAATNEYDLGRGGRIRADQGEFAKQLGLIQQLLVQIPPTVDNLQSQINDLRSQVSGLEEELAETKEELGRVFKRKATRGPRGYKGDKGDRGPRGYKGDKGDQGRPGESADGSRKRRKVAQSRGSDDESDQQSASDSGLIQTSSDAGNGYPNGNALPVLASEVGSHALPVMATTAASSSAADSLSGVLPGVPGNMRSASPDFFRLTSLEEYTDSFLIDAFSGGAFGNGRQSPENDRS